MSMTVVNAKLYVCRVLGGSGSQESIDEAGEAILRAYQDWQDKHFWSFLLKDTGQTTAVATVANGTSALTPNNVADFDFINVGATFTASAQFTGTVTVTAVTRGTDGVVTSITVNQTAAGSGAITLTFTANINVIAGTNDYALPIDFNAPYTARLLTNPRTLIYRDQRYWDRNITNQTQQGTPSEYTLYNSYSADTQNYGTQRLKFDRIPSANDTFFLRYYRKFTVNGTFIDIPDEHLYQFLDYARGLLVANKMAKDNPAAFLNSVAQGSEIAKESDEEPTEDNDLDQCMKAGYESSDFTRRLWGNGDFDAMRY